MQHPSDAVVAPEAKEVADGPGYCNLWLIRHGEKGEMPPVDWQWSLSDHGLKQAEELAVHFRTVFGDRDSKPALFASPFLRTVQTAAPIARELGIMARLEPGLGEARQGENVRPLIAAKGRVPLLVERDARIDPARFDDTHEALVAPAIPESGDQYTARIFDTVRALTEGSASSRDVIVVTHASVVTGITVALTGQPLAMVGTDGDLHEASIMQLQRVSGQPWRVVQNGSTAHLSSLGWDGYRASESSTWKAFVRKYGNGPFVTAEQEREG